MMFIEQWTVRVPLPSEPKHTYGETVAAEEFVVSESGALVFAIEDKPTRAFAHGYWTEVRLQ